MEVYMTMVNAQNCIVCAEEFDLSDMQTIALSKINTTRFKICQSCLDKSDPAEDYSDVKKIISSYLWFAETRNNFKEASEILDILKK